MLLARHADTAFEGMTMAALAIGASRAPSAGGEHRCLLGALQTMLRPRRANGLLGKAILGSAGIEFDIAVHFSAGACGCGEQAASLIKSTAVTACADAHSATSRESTGATQRWWRAA